jgi:hypothetical protein
VCFDKLGATGDFWASAQAHAGIQVWKPVVDSSQQVLASQSVYSPVGMHLTGVDANAGDHWCFEQVCFASGKMDETLLFLLQPNVQYAIDVFADTGTQDFEGNHVGNSSQTATAWADPHIYLDPDFANPQDQLFLSAGVSNDPPGATGAVPEPSTWAMMLVGFAGLALAGYRRSRRDPA